jgi:SAM-dependent methyltransferase
LTHYGSDLAYIHDIGFSDFAREAGLEAIRLLRAAGVRSGLIVDAGCGSGLISVQLARAGYGVFGFDVSADMIRLARKRLPRARFEVASLLDVVFPTCSAVIALGEVVSYAFAGRKSPLELFRRVYRALEPEGLILLDYVAPGRAPSARSAKSFREGEDWAVLVESAQTPQATKLTRRIVTFRRTGRLYRRGEETHELRVFQHEQIDDSLSRAGFRTTRLRKFGTIGGRRAYAAILAQKPA